jgi:putative SOS response-associated peptidase YedK
LRTMCGRYASTRSSADLAALFEALDETEDGLAPDYNVAPTDPVPIVRHSSRVTSRVLTVARWGLVPPWARDRSGAARMINARAETITTSKAFARPFADHRCLVPADGWYEWVAGAAGKQPYFMTRLDGGPMVFGGVWSAWGAGEGRLITFSVLTLPAEGELALVHHRMPLVLDPAVWAEWLTAPDATGLLRPPPREYAAGIELRPVSTAVGDVRNDGSDLVRAVPAPPLIKSTMDDGEPTLF